MRLQTKQQNKQANFFLEFIKGLNMGLPWLVKSTNLESSDISSSEAIAFLQFCKANADQVCTNNINRTDCLTSISSLKLHVGVSAKMHLLDALQSFNGFIIDLADGDRDVAEISTGEVKTTEELQVDEAAWAKLASASKAMMDHYCPLLSELERSAEIDGKTVDMRYVCVASHFYEMRFQVARSQRAKKEAGKTSDEEPTPITCEDGISACHRLVKLCTSFSATWHSTDRMIASWSEGLVQNRAQTFMTAVGAAARSMVTALVSEVSDAVTVTQKAIVDIASKKDFEKMLETVEKGELTEDSAKGLLEICEKLEAALLMEAFKNVEGLQKQMLATKGSLESLPCAKWEWPLQKDIQDAGESIDTGLETIEEKTADGSNVLRTMCVLQALFRPLEDNETRQKLCEKCKKSFSRKKYLKAEARLRLMLDKGAEKQE